MNGVKLSNYSVFHLSGTVRKKLQKLNNLIFILFTLIVLSLTMQWNNNPALQMMILTILSINYVAWALTHHFLEKSLTTEIVIEYVLIASLGLVVLASLFIQ